MSQKPARNKDRRQINVSTPGERRAGGTDRRKCPDCKGPLKVQLRAIASGTVTTLSCERCLWTQSSRQTDADLLLAKMSWALMLEKKGGALSAAFPAELAEALKIRPGDELLLSPHTLPMGSLPMRWAITLKRKSALKK
jgi:hypothetical protein